MPRIYQEIYLFLLFWKESKAQVKPFLTKDSQYTLCQSVLMKNVLFQDLLLTEKLKKHKSQGDFLLPSSQCAVDGAGVEDMG